MTTTELMPLNLLYETDETAWLEAMAALAAERRFSEIDAQNLKDYLFGMAKRDRRETFSRLVVLLLHLLKWERQPDHRSGSWQSTILGQRSALRKLLDSGTLYNHATATLAEAFEEARKRAAAETELPLDPFPSECPWSVIQLLEDD